MALLSAAMIVGNEEAFLSNCLQSIRNIVDEIVVVDTGSTDQTVSIAKQFDANVSVFPWKGDFAAARNEALQRCRNRWILYIDADEQLENADINQIKPFLDDPGKLAFTVRFFPSKRFTSYREYRVFRNDQRIRYEGVIHETMLPAIQKVARSDGLEIGRLPLTIRHFGFDTDQSAKYRRNLPLLKKAVIKKPERSYLWWHLGAVLMALGDKAAAAQTWEKGLFQIRKKETIEHQDTLIYGELIRYYHVQGKEVIPLINEALARFPNQYYILWLKAIALKDKHYFEAASVVFEQLTSIDSERLDEPIAYNSGIFKELSLEPLGACYFKMKRFEESAECYRRCEAIDPSNVSYKIKHQFISTRSSMGGRQFVISGKS